MEERIFNNKFSGIHFHFDNAFWAEPFQCEFIDLYQIGELCCERGFQIEEHEQGVHEITFVIFGEGKAYVDGNPVALSAGDVMINSMGHSHSIEVGQTSIFRYAYIGFRFNEKAMGEEYRELRSLFENIPYYVGQAESNLLFPFMRCVDEFQSQEVCCKEMIRSYCKQIVVLAARQFMDVQKQTVDHCVKQENVNSAIYSIIQYVEKNIETVGNIQEIAEELGYNYTYLSHFFKDKTGTTLQKYISYKKIEYASRLLGEKEMTPSQVIERLNYESLSSFSKAFRRVMGLSPRQYVASLERRRSDKKNEERCEKNEKENMEE